jgi:hypothetical protein
MPTGVSFFIRYDPAAGVLCTPSAPGTYYAITIPDPTSYNNP